MNIQANLNALLGIGAVAARTSPTYKRNAELSDIKVAEKGQAKFNQKLIEEMAKNPDKVNTSTVELLAKGSNQMKEMEIRKSQLDPKNTKNAIKTAEMTSKADEMVGAFKEKDAAEKNLEKVNKELVDKKTADEAANQKGYEEVVSSMTPQEYTLFHELQGDTKTKVQQMYALEDRMKQLKQQEADRNDYFKQIGFDIGGKK